METSQLRAISYAYSRKNKEKQVEWLRNHGEMENFKNQQKYKTMSGYIRSLGGNWND